MFILTLNLIWIKAVVNLLFRKKLQRKQKLLGFGLFATGFFVTLRVNLSNFAILVKQAFLFILLNIKA
jgi:hypothetical protein